MEIHRAEQPDGNIMPQGAAGLGLDNFRAPFKFELPPCFLGDGKEDFLQWCRRLEVAVNAYPNLDNAYLATILPTRLGGAAFSFWDSLPDHVKDNYAEVKDRMKGVFGQKHFLTTFQSYVNARPRLPNEALEVYAAEITRLVLEAFPNYDENAIEGEKFRRFIAGIHPHLQLKCHELGATTFQDALRIACQVEHAQQALNIASPNIQLSSPPLLPVTPAPKVEVANGQVSTVKVSDINRLEQKLDQICIEVDALKKEVSRNEYRHYYSDSRQDYNYSPRRENRRGRSPTRRWNDASEHDSTRYGRRNASPSPTYRSSHPTKSSGRYYGDWSPYRQPASPHYN